MGDVGILLTNKFTEMQTVICNGTINLISIIGCLIGLGISNTDDATKIYILCFVAGNFIYISADIWRNLFNNKGAPLRNVLEFFGVALGVGIMYILLFVLDSHQGHSR